MKKIIYIHNQLLIEATAKEIHDKYYNDIDYNQFFKIVSSDPKTKIQNNEIIKIGPYSKILLNIYRKGKLKNEDLPKATEYLSYIYKYNLSIDIKYINELSDLYDLVSKYIVKEKFSVENVMKSLPSHEYKILLNSKNWYIISPKSQKAACYFGFGTQWCTTWGSMSLDPKLKSRTSQYNKYKDGLYILINKNNEDEKYQFHFQTKQYKNPGDGNINAEYLLNENPDLKYYFFPSLYNKNLSSRIVDEQIEKIDILDKKDISTFTKNIYGEIDNPIVNALIENNEEDFAETINDEIKFNLSIDDYIINIPLIKKLNRYVSDIVDINHLLSSLEQSSQYVDCDESEVHYETTEGFLELYYEENKNEINKIFNIKTIDDCNKLFLDDLIKYKKYEEAFVNAECSNYEEAYDAYCSSEADRIKKFIDFDNYGDNIEINKFKFINYIIYLDIDKIDNLYGLISNYVEYNDISSDLDWDIYSFQEQINYDDVKSAIEDFFEFMGESIQNQNDDENENCADIMKKFYNIKNKIFKDEHEIDNEIVHIKMYPETIDCKNGTIRVELTNKQTDKTEDGMVKIENLPTHVQNYKLFENIIRFKNLI